LLPPLSKLAKPEAGEAIVEEISAYNIIIIPETEYT
jgi:hypothetical protein